MSIQRVYAHEKVREDQGQVALMRGPLVYCLEAADQPNVDLFRLTLPSSAQLRAAPHPKMQHPDLLGSVTVIEGEALAAGKKPQAMIAIPYFAWANRQLGAMLVWIQEAPAK